MLYLTLYPSLPLTICLLSLYLLLCSFLRSLSLSFISSSLFSSFPTAPPPRPIPPFSPLPLSPDFIVPIAILFLSLNSTLSSSSFLQDLMPVTDITSKTLLDFGGGLTPTFPSFLPLEIFDNTEYDCRTPGEWLALGQYIEHNCQSGIPTLNIVIVYRAAIHMYWIGLRCGRVDKYMFNLPFFSVAAPEMKKKCTHTHTPHITHTHTTYPSHIAYMPHIPHT